MCGIYSIQKVLTFQRPLWTLKNCLGSPVNHQAFNSSARKPVVNTLALDSRGRGFKSLSRQFLSFSCVHLFLYFTGFSSFVIYRYRYIIYLFKNNTGYMGCILVHGKTVLKVCTWSNNLFSKVTNSRGTQPTRQRWVRFDTAYIFWKLIK